MAFHAKLSPSSAHRWMNCAGSVKLIGDESSTAGVEAMRGTAAHRVIEAMLQNSESDASAYRNSLIVVHGPGGEETLILPPGSEVPIKDGYHLFVCDEKMVNGAQMMIDEVRKVETEECFDPKLYTERFLNMSWLDDRLGGTADVTIVDPDWIYLLDYKNGRILVEVKGNEQMKNYAVGLLHEHPEARGVTVRLVQPNSFHEDGFVREESYTADELKLFELQMKEAADATSKPNAPRRVGNWCTFCPAKVRCPEFDAVALEEAGADFATDPVGPLQIADNEFLEPDPLKGDEALGDEAYRVSLARKAKWIPVLDQWAREITKAILNELTNGRDVPGKKMVQTKTNRVFVEGAGGKLVEVGLPEEALYTDPKLKSPAQIEKTRPLPEGMKPAAFQKFVDGLTFKPKGRITVADSDDARPAVNPVSVTASDFADDDSEGDDFGVA